MNIADIISPERVVLGVDASSKKRALQTLAGVLSEAQPSLSTREIFDGLFARERLGSTGLGEGVAIPHARMPSLGRACAGFIRLEEGVDFDAPDGEPVDLLFGLVVPEECTEEHLQALAQIAEVFGSASLREALRSERLPEAAHGLLVSIDAHA